MGDSVFFRELGEKADIIVLLLVALVLGVRRVWVFGWTYQAKVEEAAKWEQIAMVALGLSTRGADVAETALAAARQRKAEK